MTRRAFLKLLALLAAGVCAVPASLCLTVRKPVLALTAGHARAYVTSADRVSGSVSLVLARTRVL